MKKINKKRLLFLIVCIIFIIIFLLFLLKLNTKKYIIETDKDAVIDEIYVYGNHLNLNGTIDINLVTDDINELNLLFYSKEEVRVPLKFTTTDENISFQISDKLNNGYLYDNLNINNYNLYIESSNGENTEYYNLKNNTKYKSTEYYSIRKDNEMKKMLLTNANNTINLSVKKSKDNNIYDIVIDPGHGGYSYTQVH